MKSWIDVVVRIKPDKESAYMTNAEAGLATGSVIADPRNIAPGDGQTIVETTDKSPAFKCMNITLDEQRFLFQQESAGVLEILKPDQWAVHPEKPPAQPLEMSA